MADPFRSSYGGWLGDQANHCPQRPRFNDSLYSDNQLISQVDDLGQFSSVSIRGSDGGLRTLGAIPQTDAGYTISRLSASSLSNFSQHPGRPLAIISPRESQSVPRYSNCTAPPKPSPPLPRPAREYKTDPLPRQRVSSHLLPEARFQETNSINPTLLTVRTSLSEASRMRTNFHSQSYRIHFDQTHLAASQASYFQSEDTQVLEDMDPASITTQGDSESDSPASSFKSYVHEDPSIRPRTRKRARRPKKAMQLAPNVDLVHQQSQVMADTPTITVNNAVILLIGSSLELNSSTFFHREKLEAIAILTSLVSTTIEKLISRILQDDTFCSTHKTDSLGSPFAATQSRSMTNASKIAVDDVVISLIKSSIELNRFTFFHKEKLEAIATLTSLMPTTVEKLISQVLQDDILDSSHKTDSSGSSLATTQSRSTTGSHPTTVGEESYLENRSPYLVRSALPSNQPLLMQAALSFIGGRLEKCQPTAILALLLREEGRIYQCTFKCGARFARKADLRRHEEEMNYPQEEWVCDIDPAVLVNGILICAYCGLENPSMSHAMDEHGSRRPFRSEKDLHARGKIFVRKKRYIDRLKSFHPKLPISDYLITSRFVVESRFLNWCGFCREPVDFLDSKRRSNHMANHFKQGLYMSLWTDHPTLGEWEDDGKGDEDRDDNNHDESGVEKDVAQDDGLNNAGNAQGALSSTSSSQGSVGGPSKTWVNKTFGDSFKTGI
jgi:hypothetical protein